MTEDFKHHHHTFDDLIHRIIGLRWTQIHRCTNPDHKPDCACAGDLVCNDPFTLCVEQDGPVLHCECINC